MLSNACFLAKFPFETAENDPAKKFAKIANFPLSGTTRPTTDRLARSWSSDMLPDERGRTPARASGAS